MQSIKISQVWSEEDCRYYLVPRIIENIFKIKLIWTKPQNCDLLIVGPYRKFGKIRKKIIKKFSFLNRKIIEDYNRKILFRKYKPITLFYSMENLRSNFENSDFSISHDFNYDNDENYIRIPMWKECVDWSDVGLSLPPNGKLNSKRFGSYYSLEKLTNPFNQNFIKKTKKICTFFSYLTRPRDQFLKIIKSYFELDGFGPAFDKKIINHNSSDFFKIDIMKNYFANFCPERDLYPGYYTEKVPDAYLGETLPITWADQRIEHDFNKNAFINLNNYHLSDLKDLFIELKSETFLKRFQKEPLITNKINIEDEIKFTKRILDKLNIINN